jgi:hypothetical protein
VTAPPRVGTRINPQTGKRETYEAPPPVDLERSRKELRDFLRGNYQWHDDPNAAPKPKPPIDDDDEPPTVPDWIGIYGY